MGTERDEIYTRPCFCGKGTFSIVECSPDHCWATSNSVSHEFDIKCADCRKDYELLQQENLVIAVERTEIVKQQKLRDQWYEAGSELMKDGKVIELLAAFVKVLNQQSSMAAVHRLLQKAHLELSSLATFRKRWTGAEAWVSRRVRASSLPQVMEVLGLNDNAILTEVTKINELWQKSQAPLPTVGDPIYKL